MAKLHSDPITAEDLSTYLETSDFQLELDVLNSLATRCARASHGGTYTDPATQKDRQYDLRAELIHGICTLKLAIECKNLKANFPLLISRVPRTVMESYHEVILGRKNSLPVQSGDIFRADGQIFRSREPVGKSATQVGKLPSERKQEGSQIVSSDSETYDKWSQAIASTNELISQCGHSSLGDDTVNAAVVQPVLVVPDQTLWIVDYSADGVITNTPRQTEECSLFLGKTVAAGHIKYRISHLLIFTKSSFEQYLGKLQDNRSDEWENLFPDNHTLVNYESGRPLRPR
ncbi:MAG TPA: hypothetical protein VEX43_10995 [Chthoniobacterales bacterium]|nr:hypothetical protein [Chthoniobacterales bacterium]